MPITTSSSITDYIGSQTVTNTQVGTSKMQKFKVGDEVKWVKFASVPFLTLSIEHFNLRLGKKLKIIGFDSSYRAYRTSSEFGDYWIPEKQLQLWEEPNPMSKLNLKTFTREVSCISPEAEQIASEILEFVTKNKQIGFGLDEFNQIKVKFKQIQTLIKDYHEEDEVDYIKEQIKEILSIMSKFVKAQTKEALLKKAAMEELKQQVKIKDNVPF